MLVLIMGHRLPLARCLEKLQIPYIVWTEKPVLNKLSAIQSVIKDFPVSREEVINTLNDGSKITHVIAAIEKSVIPASNIRLWFKLKRNPHNLILKCTDKYRMKSYLLDKNIPMTDFCSIGKHSNEDVINKLGWPVVLKPKLSSGGRGIMFLSSEEELNTYKSRDYYYEKAINGKEGSIESFIVDKEIVFSNITEYFKKGSCNKVPARYSEIVKAKIIKLNREVISALNIRWGMTHLEYYIVEDDIFFGEVALRPPGGYIMEALAMVYNFDAWELFIKVELDILKDEEFQQKNFGASIVVHPPGGLVTKIEGEEEIRKLVSLKEFKLNLKVGDLIGKRESVGQSYGHAFFCHESAANLDQDIDSFYSLLKIEQNSEHDPLC